MAHTNTLPGAWPVLIVFTIVAGITQFLWLNFAPLLALVQTRYGVSEFVASTLILVFPLLYVVLSLHAGRLIDRRGLRFTVGWGATVTALGAMLRVFDQSFWLLLVAQLVIAAAQPYVVNGISKLVTEWFGEGQRAIATGIGTIGMFVGMAVGMAATPALVAATSLRLAMLVCALVSALAAALFWLVAKDSPRALLSASGPPPKGLRVLLADRNLRLVFALSFLGLGYFNGLTTWLEQILAPNGIGAESAGLIGGALIVGGVVGAGVVPAISDALRRRKPFLLVCVVAAAGLTLPLCTGRSQTGLLVLAALLGFCFLPAYAILLEMCSELAGNASAGYATGLLMLLGNAGGVVVIIAMAAVKGDGPSYLRAVWLMEGLLALMFLLASWVGETHRGRVA